MTTIMPSTHRNANIEAHSLYRLLAVSLQADYLRTLPLHSSQKELASVHNSQDPYTDFEYRLSLTIDLINELLSKNDGIEVIEPKSLRLKMQANIEKMTKRYQQNSLLEKNNT